MGSGNLVEAAFFEAALLCFTRLAGRANPHTPRRPASSRLPPHPRQESSPRALPPTTRTRAREKNPKLPLAGIPNQSFLPANIPGKHSAAEIAPASLAFLRRPPAHTPAHRS